jgi:hypothetical protein
MTGAPRLRASDLRALAAVAHASATRPARRPLGVSFGALDRLMEAGLVAAAGTAPTPSGRGRVWQVTLYAATNAGRSVLTSPNPAGAVAALVAPPREAADGRA